MKFLPSMAMLVLVAGLSGAAVAQMPFPFGGQPQPEPGKMPKCTKDYVKSVETQIAAMEKLRASGPELVGQICTLIESGSALLGGELPDSVRQQLKGLLGVDVDLALHQDAMPGRPGQSRPGGHEPDRLPQGRARALRRHDLA
jgi:hypothetical protein